MPYRLLLLLSFCLAAIQWSPSSARADYVFYFVGFEDWTLSCAKNRLTEERYCQITAPKPHEENAPYRSALTAKVTPSGLVTILLSVRGVTPRPSEARLLINEQVFDAHLSFHGESLWQGDNAEILADAIGRASSVGVDISGTGIRHDIPTRGLIAAIAKAVERLNMADEN